MAKVMENFIQQNFVAKILKQFSTVCYQPKPSFRQSSLFSSIWSKKWFKKNLIYGQKKAPDFSGASSFLSGKLIIK
jgi:hypothetical protein